MPDILDISNFMKERTGGPEKWQETRAGIVSEELAPGRARELADECNKLFPDGVWIVRSGSNFRVVIRKNAILQNLPSSPPTTSNIVQVGIASVKTSVKKTPLVTGPESRTLQEVTGYDNWELRPGQVVSPLLSQHEAQQLQLLCQQRFSTDVSIHSSRDKPGLFRVVMPRQGITKIIPLTVTPPDLKTRFQNLAKKNLEIEGKLTFTHLVPNRFNNPGTRCPDATQLIDPKTKQPFQLHANYVELEGIKMICSQAPLPESEVAFWSAASNNTQMIVDITNKTDRETHNVRRYFPNNVGEKIQNPSITVSCIEKEHVPGEEKLKRHTYLVQETGEAEKPITRLHYRGWPDHGAITTNDLTTLVNHIRSDPQAIGNEWLWIHCRAGIGRTGTVAVALALAQMNSEGRLTRDNYAQQIDDLIIKGRSQRDIGFVQTLEQYQLLHAFAQGLVDGSIKISPPAILAARTTDVASRITGTGRQPHLPSEAKIAPDLQNAKEKLYTEIKRQIDEKNIQPLLPSEAKIAPDLQNAKEKLYTEIKRQIDEKNIQPLQSSIVAAGGVKKALETLFEEIENLSKPGDTEADFLTKVEDLKSLVSQTTTFVRDGLKTDESNADEMKALKDLQFQLQMGSRQLHILSDMKKRPLPTLQSFIVAAGDVKKALEMLFEKIENLSKPGDTEADFLTKVDDLKSLVSQTTTFVRDGLKTDESNADEKKALKDLQFQLQMASRQLHMLSDMKKRPLP